MKQLIAFKQTTKAVSHMSLYFLSCKCRQYSYSGCVMKSKYFRSKNTTSELFVSMNGETSVCVCDSDVCIRYTLCVIKCNIEGDQLQLFRYRLFIECKEK